MKTIGMLEFTSICRGIEACDAMVKAGDVDLITAKTACPGKYMILVTGDVGAVKSAVEAGEEVGKHYVVDRLVMANAHPQTIRSVQGFQDVKFFDALGVMEFYSLTSARIRSIRSARSSSFTQGHSSFFSMDTSSP